MRRWTTTATAVALGAAGYLAYRAVGGPWQRRWGATDDEASGPLPGDELVPDPAEQATRAVTVHAPPAEVWSWVVQLGADRGGFYSYDWLENLFGLGIHSAERVVPEWQHRAVGDLVHADARGTGGWVVADVRPGEALVLQLADVGARRAIRRDEGLGWEFLWSFVVRPGPEGTTRLIVRERTGFGRAAARVLMAPVGLVSFVMSRRMLMGIKARAEAGAPGMVDVDVDGGPMGAYLARPEGAGPHPGVLVVHDALGMTADLRRHADWLAANGYLALAPDLYHRGSRLRCLFETMRDLARGEGPAFEDLEAARRSLAHDPACTGAVGVIGFCMGGGYALMLSTTGRYDAASVNYGDLADDLYDELAHACPIVASYGGRDRSLREVPDRLGAALAEAGIDHDVVTYPDAGHGFLNDHEPGDLPWWASVAGRIVDTGYDEVSAADARGRILAFFARHLGPPTGVAVAGGGPGGA